MLPVPANVVSGWSSAHSVKSPPVAATFVFQLATLAEAMAERDRILSSPLQPVAIDAAF